MSHSHTKPVVRRSNRRKEELPEEAEKLRGQAKTYKVPARALDPSFVAKATGMPLSAWPGNCTGVCTEILKAKVVKGELRRGLWIGHISALSTFASRPFAGHTWIRLPDGRVYDPTRFAFRGQEPYIYVSEQKEEYYSQQYDFGGNVVRSALRQPFPCAVEPASKWMTLRLRKSTADKLITLAGKGSGLTAANTTKKVCGAYARLRLTWSQAGWLANASLYELGEQAKDFYLALVKNGHGALIPWDNRYEVLKKE